MQSREDLIECEMRSLVGVVRAQLDLLTVVAILRWLSLF